MEDRAPHLSSSNFIEEIIEEGIKNGDYKEIHTRFPPEPNGYLHIGHAKSICLNFGIAKKYGGKVNLRFDDTNPSAESVEYVDSIKKDVAWLGFSWDEELYTSDYFEQLYAFAQTLIKKNVAYVDDSSLEEIAEQRGVPTLPGKESPYRARTAEENLRLFEEMRKGLHKEESKVLRAKIDMASPNMHLRDPILYRIKRAPHHRVGEAWPIYPMYDFAHGQSDAIEKITHSICTLEFAPHRPLYDWFIRELDIFPSKQYEFARLNLSYTVMSKRKLARLVKEGIVDGWDDPRMPTISGMRSRGYTPVAIRNFCEQIGVQKRDNVIEFELLEFFVREHLNQIALRRMVVFHPLKVVLTNFDKEVEYLEAENNPEDPKEGKRLIPFTKELYIEREDFMETPPPNYFRLAPGAKVRLKHAYIIECTEVIRAADGSVKEVRCAIVPNSKSGEDTSGVKAKGTLHWVSATHAKQVKIYAYDRLFSKKDPSKEDDFLDSINPTSLVTIDSALAEPALAEDSTDKHFQFLRKGYFYPHASFRPDNLIYNQTVSLKDSWTKQKG